MANDATFFTVSAPVYPEDGVFFSTSVWGQGDLVFLDAGYGVYFADAEKTRLDVNDDNLCWAAAAANLLLQCGYRSGFADEDRILDLFSDNWDNRVGWVEQALSWYFNGKAYYVSSSIPDGGNYFSSLQPKSLISVVYALGVNSAGAVASLVNYLEAGYGVAINMQGALEHVVTVWGYGVENGVIRLYYSDSDDNKNNDFADRRDAVNMLRSTTVSYDAANSRWILDNLGGAYLYNFTALARYDAVFSGKQETFADAEVLTIENGTAVRRGNLDAIGDRDYYSVDATGTTVTISIRPVYEDFDGALEWSVYCGGTLLFSSGKNNFGSFTWTLTGGTADLYVVVGGTRDSSNGVGSSNYTVRVGTDAGDAPVAAPENLDDSRSGSAVTLSWSEVAGMAYLVEYSSSGDFADGSVTRFFSSSSSLALIFADGLYYWRVAAIDEWNILSAWTTAAEALLVDTVAPGRVSGASGRQNGDEIIFAWNAVSDFSGVGYELQYSLAADFSGALDIVATTNSLNVAAWRDGLYYWRIRAVDGGGNAGAWSVTGTISVDTVAPQQVTGLGAVSEQQRMRLSFDTVSDSDLSFYEIRYGTENDLASADIFRIGTAVSFLSPMQNAGDFYFQVRAVDASGNGGVWSEVFHGEVLTMPPVVAARGGVCSWNGTAGTEYEVDFGSFGTLYILGTGFSLYNPGGIAGAWRVRAEGGEWSAAAPFAAGSASAAPKVVTTGEGVNVILGRSGNEYWNNSHQLVNSLDDREAAISLGGRLRSVDGYRGGEGYDILFLGDGGNTLILDDIYSASALPGMAARLDGIEEIRGGSGGDVMDFTSNRWNGGGLTIYDGAGDDVIWCGAGDDRIMAGEGDDLYHGGGGNDIFAFGGNWGNDVVKTCEGGALTLLFADDQLSIEQQGADLLITSGGNSIRVVDFAAFDLTLCVAESLDGFRRFSTENSVILPLA